jgi:hypothetical protein
VSYKSTFFSAYKQMKVWRPDKIFTVLKVYIFYIWAHFSFIMLKLSGGTNENKPCWNRGLLIDANFPLNKMKAKQSDILTLPPVTSFVMWEQQHPKYHLTLQNATYILRCAAHQQVQLWQKLNVRILLHITNYVCGIKAFWDTAACSLESVQYGGRIFPWGAGNSLTRRQGHKPKDHIMNHHCHENINP